MPIVLDLHQLRPEAVSVQLSQLAELMAFLHAAAEPAHHLDRRQEIQGMGRTLSDETNRAVRALAPFWARFRARHLMPLTFGQASGFAHELKRLENLDLEVFAAFSAEVIYGTRMMTFPDVTRSQVAAADFVARAEERSEARGILAAQLIRDPDELRSQLITTLKEVNEKFFSERWSAALPLLKTAQAEVQNALATQLLPMVFTSLNPGTHYFHSTQQIAFDKLQNAFISSSDDRKYVLLPSSYGSPHLVIKFAQDYGHQRLDLPVVIQFPLTEMGVPTNNTIEEIRLRLTVMADPARMDLCRHLVNEHCTTTELAKRTGMTVPQVSRHLRRLRDSGLLDSVKDGRMVRNRLNLRAVYSLGYDLISSIVR